MGLTGRSAGGGTRRLGDFVLLEELGRGGMGVVYRARQEALGRIVALKMLPSFAGLDRDAVARFRREAESAARISHPGIVPVFAVGEDEGTYYYAMELVDGPPLDAALGELEGRNPSRLLNSIAVETSLGERCPAFLESRWVDAPRGARYAVSCAAIAVDLANALSVAHRANIIHRDLKPSNLLLGAAGRPMIVDFGLARDQTAVGLTQSGDTVGTPSYMAPEQAYGQRDLDARVDVYGFGATLYEMLTLQPPFDGAHAADIMRRIIEEEPVPVRSLNSRVPRDLATIVHKCLAKDRDARYPAMEGVEHDLRAFLQSRSIAAQAPSLWRRSVGFASRHRRGMGVAAVTTVVLSLGGVVADMWNGTRRREEGRTQLDKAREEIVLHANLDAAQECYGRANQLLGEESAIIAARFDHLNAAFAAWYDKPDKRVWLERLLGTVAPELRTPEWSMLQRRLHGESQCQLQGHLLDSETTIELRRFDGSRFVAVEEGWPSDGKLAAGHYLVQLDRVGLVPAATAFTVERDTKHDVFVPELMVGTVEEDEVVIAQADDRARVFALAKTELSGAEFAHLMSGLTPAQRAEFAAVEANGDALPVRNLTFRQARSLAALAGGHLPSLAEFKLAARASAPAAAMTYPWGTTFVDRLVNADPARSSQPDPVDSRADGASPFGVLHLVGNVAEIVSGAIDGVPRQAGGDHLSRPDQVRIDAAEPIVDLDAPLRRGGVRVARFVYPPDATERTAAADAESRLGALWRDGSVAVIHDWDFDAEGGARLTLRLSKYHVDGERKLDLPLATPGFLQAGALLCHLGSEPTEPVRELGVGGEMSLLRIDTDALTPRQLFRVEVKTALTPLSGLLGRADGYVLQVPLKANGTTPMCSRVALPPGCRVDDVDPAPTRQYVEKGRPILIWEFGVDGGGVRTFSGVVRFRKDGWLCGQWPTKAEAMGAVGELFGALRARDNGALRQLLAPTFTLLPSNVSGQHLVGAGRTAHEWFDNVRFVDVTAVGSVVTADLLADWHVTDQGVERKAANWPLRVHWQRVGDHARFLQVTPAARGDSGRLEDGVYLQDELLLRIEPSSEVTLSRTVGHLASVQVELQSQPRKPYFIMVLGQYEEHDSDEDAIWQRLSDGFDLIGGDKRCLGREKAKVCDHPAQREEWSCATAVGYTRERWLRVSAGRRRLLIRMVAVSRMSEEAAAAEFEGARPWFDAVLPRVGLQ